MYLRSRRNIQMYAYVQVFSKHNHRNSAHTYIGTMFLAHTVCTMLTHRLARLVLMTLLYINSSVCIRLRAGVPILSSRDLRNYVLSIQLLEVK